VLVIRTPRVQFLRQIGVGASDDGEARAVARGLRQVVVVPHAQAKVDHLDEQQEERNAKQSELDGDNATLVSV
jgi:hypothetical protein